MSDTSEPPLASGDLSETNRTTPWPRYSRTALVLIIAAAFPLRFKLAFAVFGSITLLDVILLLASFRLLIGLLAHRGRVNLGDSRVTLTLIFPFLVCAFSLVWTVDRTATLRATGIFAEAVFAYGIALNIFCGLQLRELFRLAALLVCLLLVGSLLSLLQVRGFEPPPRDLVVGSPDYVAYLAAYYARLGNPFYGLSNDFASVLALYVLPLLAWGVLQRRVFYSVVGGVAFAGVVLTLSRGVIFATACGCLLFLVLERRKLGRWVFGIAITACLLLVVGYLYYQLNQAVQSYLVDRLSVANIEARQLILRRAFDELARAPLLGYGAGVVTDPLLADGVHNTYLQQALYYGLPLGLMCAAALWFLAARYLTWRSRSHAIRTMAIAVGLSVIIQLVEFMGETSFEATLPKTAFYMFAAFGSAVLFRMTDEQRASTSEVDSAAQ